MKRTVLGVIETFGIECYEAFESKHGVILERCRNGDTLSENSVLRSGAFPSVRYGFIISQEDRIK